MRFTSGSREPGLGIIFLFFYVVVDITKAFKIQERPSKVTDEMANDKKHMFFATSRLG
jgi:hypothetical protein